MLESIDHRGITPELITEISGADAVAVDTETTGLDFDDRILGIGISWLKEGEIDSLYLNAGHPPSLFFPRHPLEGIRAIIQAARNPERFFMHNALFDLERLARWDYMQPGEWPSDSQLVDTQTLSRIAVPFNHKESTSLKHLSARLLGGMPADVASMKNNRGQFAMMPAEKVERYGRADAEYTLRLGLVLLEEAAKAYDEPDTLSHLLRRESAFGKLLTRMQLTGILLNSGWVQEQMGILTRKREEAAARLKGEGLQNPASRSEVISLFRDRGAKLPLTEKGNPRIDEDSLVSLDDPLAGVLLEWRGFDKAISTWLEGFLDKVADDGRLHPRFHAAGTISGRLSCRSPNLQAIPMSDRGASFGSMGGLFLAPGGSELWAVDYGQAELRMLTSYAQSAVMAQSFHKGKDVHKETAREMWPGEEIDRIKRQYGKGANYTISYGGGAGALSVSTGLPYEDAKEVIRRHRRAFPGIAHAQRTTERVWVDRGWLKLLSGRRRWLGGNEKDRAYKAFNQLIQGGVAEMMKDAMLAVDRLMAGTSSRLLLQIHDSIEGELSREDLDRGIKEEIAQAMIDAYPAWLSKRTDPPVRMVVDWERWYPPDAN